MEEEQASPPRRTLGDYVMYRRPRHFSSVVIPTTTRALAPFSLLSSVPSKSHQRIMRIHIHIWIHFMNWWEPWASIR